MVKIVVDSGCDLTQCMRNNIGINLEAVPLSLQVDDINFIDDDTLNIDTYLDAMEKSPNTPKTAAPSPESYLSKYIGEESVFAVTLTSGLSGSYNSALLAKELYLEEFGEKFIHVFDSLSAAGGEMVIALKINELSKMNFKDSEIVTAVNKFISNMRTYFILDRVDNLVKTGRMNPYIAKIASVLNIKPICAATSDGKIRFVDKARGYKKSASKLIDIMEKERLDFENRILGITHVKCLEKAVAFKEEVTKKINFKEIIISEASGLCTNYASRNGIIIAY